MKAIVQNRYGSPDTLELRDVELPSASGTELLVRVRAASVNAYDWHVMRGDPYLARLTGIGLARPRATIRGRDFAGTVEAVGRDVRRFRPGDEVFGDLGTADGAFAEYVSVPEDLVEAKPSTLTFEQAAALPLAGQTALKGLRGNLQQGQRVLINGASGGVGTFAVQIARSLGATVTAVCSTRNAGLVRSLGADHVLDHVSADFTTTGDRYDLVFDLVGNHSLTGLRRALSPGGTIVLSGGGVFDGGSLLGPMRLMLGAKLRAPFVRDRVVVLTTAAGCEHLTALRHLVESGVIGPVIDRTYSLAEACDAVRYVETGRARGKVVIAL
ncbi:NAD(P)-dependent alcohol dehydrogenase [Lentzea sp. NBRC 102530]|uniref:NAD(P)-dependent alcohol dehydrogenase n=1 Tax=Lentzea sp. NBRC 102530 TaxID=3032201 RepID=UPI0024A2E18D|nr:NAD(P)-dependent alcohol dehydrogenase [Lentzea sp. NBRC 102530]GLY47668.1 NADPH:quinone reductase [Lentzea sp. NBRC 102530]